MFTDTRYTHTRDTGDWWYTDTDPRRERSDESSDEEPSMYSGESSSHIQSHVASSVSPYVAGRQTAWWEDTHHTWGDRGLISQRLRYRDHWDTQDPWRAREEDASYWSEWSSWNNGENNFNRWRDYDSRVDARDEPRPPPLIEMDEELLRNAWPSIMELSSFEIFVCPITHGVMTDPVVTADGHTYERSAIELWFESSRKSPVTGLELSHKALIPNQSIRTLLKSLIDAVQERLSCTIADVNEKQSLPESLEKPYFSPVTAELPAASSSSVDRRRGRNIALAAFDGREYGENYLVFAAGDTVIGLSHPDTSDDGWSFGLLFEQRRSTLLRTQRLGWFPDEYVAARSVGDARALCVVRQSFDGSAYGPEYHVLKEGDFIEEPTEGNDNGWVRARSLHTDDREVLSRWLPASALQLAIVPHDID